MFTTRQNAQSAANILEFTKGKDRKQMIIFTLQVQIQTKCSGSSKVQCLVEGLSGRFEWRVTDHLSYTK